MNKEELTALVVEIVGKIAPEPMVKGSDYKPANPGPVAADCHHGDGDFVADVSELDLRKLYLVEQNLLLEIILELDKTICIIKSLM